jgi:hypothetical protein
MKAGILVWQAWRLANGHHLIRYGCGGIKRWQ